MSDDLVMLRQSELDSFVSDAQAANLARIAELEVEREVAYRLADSRALVAREAHARAEAAVAALRATVEQVWALCDQVEADGLPGTANAFRRVLKEDSNV